MFVPKDLAVELQKEIDKLAALKKKWTKDHEEIILKPALGVGDYLLPDRINFNAPGVRLLEFSFTPTPESTYWRCGFRFSKSGWPLMLPQRTATGYPLWHLTQNEGSPLIGSTYYNENCIQDTTEGMLIPQYKNDSPIKIYLYPAKLDKEEVIRLVVNAGGEIKYVKNLTWDFHQYCWIGAWADQFNFEIKAELSIK